MYIFQSIKLFSVFDMDIWSYFGSSSKPSSKPLTSDNSSSSSSDEEGAIAPTKKPCVSTHERSKTIEIQYK